MFCLWSYHHNYKNQSSNGIFDRIIGEQGNRTSQKQGRNFLTFTPNHQTKVKSNYQFPVTDTTQNSIIVI